MGRAGRRGRGDAAEERSPQSGAHLLPWGSLNLSQEAGVQGCLTQPWGHPGAQQGPLKTQPRPPTTFLGVVAQREQSGCQVRAAGGRLQAPGWRPALCPPGVTQSHRQPGGGFPRVLAVAACLCSCEPQASKCRRANVAPFSVFFFREVAFDMCAVFSLSFEANG